jgi:aspartyl protease family protein
MTGRLFWIVIAVTGAALILLIVNDEGGMTLGLANDVFAQTVYLGIWGTVVAAGFLRSGIPLGAFARNAAFWILIMLLLVAGYQYRYEFQDIAHRVTAGLVPGSPLSTVDGDGAVTVTLIKSADGHFEAAGTVNGVSVDFLVDTGASTVVLTEDDAQRAGISPEGLVYSTPIMTANGAARAASVRLDTVSIGGIERHGLRALVARKGQLPSSLLGMDFLETLDGFNVRGDRLTLID